MYLILLSQQQASLETQRTNQDGTLDTPRLTVDKHECTVGFIGHMVEKLDGHLDNSGWTVETKIIQTLNNQVNTLSCNHLGSREY